MDGFAANCPESCPPAAARDVAGPIFRFVRCDPPAWEDMRTYADEDKPADDGCQRSALSVLVRAEDVPVARKAMPWFKRRKVAMAHLMPEHGMICQTGAHRWHFSLWVRVGHGGTIHQRFEVVAA